VVGSVSEVQLGPTLLRPGWRDLHPRHR
jgi:hypothetical protein